MEKYKTPLVLCSILFALALPLLNAVAAHKAQKEWPIVKFLIEPYDPRDLLYGHYMTFQFKWNWSKNAQTDACYGDDCCLCVGAGDYNPEVYATNCPPKGETLPSCKHILKGSYYGQPATEEEQIPTHNFQIGIDRFYVDESLALPLEHLFRTQKEEFAIGLGMNPAGKPVVEQLYVGNKRLHAYVAEKGGSLSIPEPAIDETITPDIR